MPKTDYFDDPAAPRANSLVVAVSAVIVDGMGRVLMIQRTDNGLWAIPGGGLEIGETVKQAATREIREETGIEAELAGLVGIFSDPRHVIAYDDGEVRQEFSICFRGRPSGGQPRTSDESALVEWVETSQLGELDIHPSIRLRIDHRLRNDTRPFVS